MYIRAVLRQRVGRIGGVYPLTTSLRAVTDTTAATPIVLVLNDPGLNHLGKRQPGVHGATTLADARSEPRTLAEELGVMVDCHQPNYKGQLIEWVHEAVDYGWPVVINPGGLTHTSVVPRDAPAETADGAGLHEIHISDIHAREESRHYSYLSALAADVIVGCGTGGYFMALRRVSTTL